MACCWMYLGLDQGLALGYPGVMALVASGSTRVLRGLVCQRRSALSEDAPGMAGVKTTRGDAYEYLAGKMGPENTKEKQSSATLYTWNRDKGLKITLSVGDQGAMVTVELP